jgi:hypothetical protein
MELFWCGPNSALHTPLTRHPPGGANNFKEGTMILRPLSNAKATEFREFQGDEQTEDQFWS